MAQTYFTICHSGRDGAVLRLRPNHRSLDGIDLIARRWVDGQEGRQ